MRKISWMWFVLVSSVLACSGEAPGEAEQGGGADVHFDLGGIDASTAQDAEGRREMGTTGDLGPSDVTARADQGAGPGAGFGLLSGQCGGLSAELDETESSLFENRIDFQLDPFDDGDLAELSAGGAEILSDGNAGGGSLLSEVFAFEVLYRCDGAELLKSENEILYEDPMGKRTDLLVSIDGQRVGVSVTRAVGFPRDAPYTAEDATVLIEKKLEGVQSSTQNVAAADSWDKQILHILAYSEEHARAIRMAYDASAESLRTDTIVVVTQTDGDDEFLYE
jgi:hypothetical protein